MIAVTFVGIVTCSMTDADVYAVELENSRLRTGWIGRIHCHFDWTLEKAVEILPLIEFSTVNLLMPSKTS